MLTGGNPHDVMQPEVLLGGEASAVLADMGYDSRALRRGLEAQRCALVIPPMAGTTCPPGYDEDAYKDRNRIKRAFAHLKDYRRVATCYVELARNFVAAVALTAVRRWLMI